MAERITEEQVEELQNVLASDKASIDTKVTKVTAIKTGIKHHNVPDECVAPLFEALRKAARNQHANLVNAGLTSLNHLLTRLSRQDPRYIHQEKAATVKLFVEKMGDQKDKFRLLAIQSLVTMCKVEGPREDVEKAVKEIMESKNVKAKSKEASVQWLLLAHEEAGLPFKTYVPSLMRLLENGDPGVRDAAKHTVIGLFRDAPGTAKADVKKKLKEFGVRPAIEAAILKELVPRATATTPAPDVDMPEPAPLPIRPNLAASVSSSISVERPITPMPDTRTETIEPSYINTTRELDDMFRGMHAYFEGNESEHNWKLREQSINKLRRLIAGNATDFYDHFLVGLRGLLDGIIKAVKSLRTSLSKEGCGLVQDMAFAFGPGIDPMVELLMQAFLQLAGATKKIASQAANVCVDAIMARVTFTKRLMEHIAAASRDKNVQPRLYATQWLKTMLLKEGKNKSHIEHIGGLDLIEQAIKKGLADANPGVREKMRGTFWVFHSIWPARAEALMDTLEPTAQKLLEKDPNNPNTPRRTEATGTARPGMGLSRSTMGTKPSIRDAIKAQRAAISRPGSAMEPSRPRPGSAMDFSPPRNIRTVSGASNASGPSLAPPAGTRTKIGGLSGAPVRPRTRTGPNIPPRPKTAGPYDVRSGTEPGLASPPQVRKAVTPRTMVGSPKRTVVPRVRPGHQPTTSESNIPTPTRFGSPRSPTGSPAPLSPMRSRLPPGPLLGSSPRASPKLEDVAMMPSIMDVADSPTPEIRSPLLAAPELTEPAVEIQEEILPPAVAITDSAEATPAQNQQSSAADASSQTLKVYEDPHSEEQSPTRLLPTAVLEEKPVNEDAANLVPRQNGDAIEVTGNDEVSPDKANQQARLIDSALNKIKAKNLDVHGFRRFQSIMRDAKAPIRDDKFDALLLGLFDYLEDPQASLAPEKVQDVKAQILATIKLLLKKHRANFQPHISKALESLMAARAAYDARTHIVSGLELLADELVPLGDAQEIATVLTRRMAGEDARNAAGCRSLTMGLHVLKEMVDRTDDFIPTDADLGSMAALCMRCMESSESGVRMDAVQLGVALHARVGDARFWEVMRDVKDDPKSLITYYIVKRQREKEATTTNGTARA
ncbi:unnamed protein product [Discula destructiva]